MSTGAVSLRVAVLTCLACMPLLGCADRHDPTGLNGQQGLAPRTDVATQTSVSFTVGTLILTGLDPQFPDSRLRFTATLIGPVAGDLVGTADLLLKAQVDGPGGSGPVSGTLAIHTAAGEWQGNLAGYFVGAGPGVGSQLFSRVNLHGPDGAKLAAECDETSAPSEFLVCTGEILRP